MLLIGALFFAERPQRGQMIGAALSLAGVAVVAFALAKLSPVAEMDVNALKKVVDREYDRPAS